MYDVVISGCGPAGANAAYQCASAGLQVLMIDREDFPRQKCCAGGLLARAYARLPDFPASIIEKEITGAKFVLGDQSLEIKSDKRVAVTVKREKFDTFLLQRALEAGAEAVTGIPVTKAIEKNDHVDITYGNETVSSKLFIVAEGASSRIANLIFGAPAHSAKAIAFAQDLLVGSDPGDNFVIYTIGRSPTKPKLRNRFPAYGWAFPRKDSVNIGVGGVGYPTAYFQQSLEKILKHVDIQHHLVAAETIKAHPIPYSIREKFYTRRCMAVGDSAGFASPLSGEGFTYAIVSGQDAGQAAIDFIQQNTSLAEDYGSRIKSDILPYLRSSTLAARLVALSASFCNIPTLVEEFSSDEAIKKTCIEYVLGNCDWTKLFSSCMNKLPRAVFRSFGHPFVPEPPFC